MDDSVFQRLQHAIARLRNNAFTPTSLDALTALESLLESNTIGNHRSFLSAVREAQTRGDDVLPIIELYESIGMGTSRDRRRVPDGTRHKNVGISMSPNTAEKLKEMALGFGIPQGELIARLLDSGRDAVDGSHFENGIATAEQRHLALMLTRASFKSGKSAVTDHYCPLLIIDLYQKMLTEILARGLNG